MKRLYKMVSTGLFLLGLIAFGCSFTTSFAHSQPPEIPAIPAEDIDKVVIDIEDLVYHLRGRPAAEIEDTLRDWAVYGTLIRMQLEPQALARASTGILPVRPPSSDEILGLVRGPGRGALVTSEDALLFIDETDSDAKGTIDRLAGELRVQAGGLKPALHIFRIAVDKAANVIRVERVSSKQAKAAGAGLVLLAGPKGRFRGRPRSTPDPVRGSAPDTTYKSTPDYTPPPRPSIPAPRSVPWYRWTEPSRPRQPKPGSTSIHAKGISNGGAGGSGTSIKVSVIPRAARQIEIKAIGPAGVALGALVGGYAGADRVKLELHDGERGADGVAASTTQPGRGSRAPLLGKKDSSQSSIVMSGPAPEPWAQRALDGILREEPREALRSMIGGPKGDPARLAATAIELRTKVADQADQLLAQGEGVRARPLYDFLAEVEGHGSPEIELRRALAQIQSGLPQRALARMGNPPNLSPEAIAIIEGTPGLGDLPGYVAVRQAASLQVLGAPALELELVAEGLELRSTVKVVKLPEGKPISAQEVANIVNSPVKPVFYVEDVIRQDQPGREASGKGGRADTAASPDAEWAYVLIGGEPYQPGILVDTSNGKRYRRVDGSLEGDRAPGTERKSGRVSDELKASDLAAGGGIPGVRSFDALEARTQAQALHERIATDGVALRDAAMELTLTHEVRVLNDGRIAVRIDDGSSTKKWAIMESGGGNRGPPSRPRSRRAEAVFAVGMPDGAPHRPGSPAALPASVVRVWILDEESAASLFAERKAKPLELADPALVALKRKLDSDDFDGAMKALDQSPSAGARGFLLTHALAAGGDTNVRRVVAHAIKNGAPPQELQTLGKKVHVEAARRAREGGDRSVLDQQVLKLAIAERRARTEALSIAQRAGGDSAASGPPNYSLEAALPPASQPLQRPLSPDEQYVAQAIEGAKQKLLDTAGVAGANDIVRAPAKDVTVDNDTGRAPAKDDTVGTKFAGLLLDALLPSGRPVIVRTRCSNQNPDLPPCKSVGSP